MSSRGEKGVSCGVRCVRVSLPEPMGRPSCAPGTAQTGDLPGTYAVAVHERRRTHTHIHKHQEHGFKNGRTDQGIIIQLILLQNIH